MNIEKLKAAAIASINHDGSNYYSHTYNHTKASDPATILELIERLEAAENQRDELLSAVELYEEALKASWPSGAEYDAFEYWNYARKAIANVKDNHEN